MSAPARLTGASFPILKAGMRSRRPIRIRAVATSSPDRVHTGVVAAAEPRVESRKVSIFIPSAQSWYLKGDDMTREMTANYPIWARSLADPASFEHEQI